MICRRICGKVLISTFVIALLVSYGTSGLWAVGFESPEGAHFVPQWQKGDRWVVKTESIDTKVSSLNPQPRENLPAQNLWMYKVVNTRDEIIKGETIRFFHVMASNWRSQKKDVGGYLFAGRMNRALTKVLALSLIQAVWKNGLTGEEIVRDYSKMGPNPFPVVNDSSPIPSSFPIFIDNQIVGGMVGMTFEITKKIGVLPFARDVIQQVRVATDSDLETIKLSLSKKQKANACNVVIRRFDDNFQATQLWHRSYPWFLYCDNGNFRSWLVKYKAVK